MTVPRIRPHAGNMVTAENSDRVLLPFGTPRNLAQFPMVRIKRTAIREASRPSGAWRGVLSKLSLMQCAPLRW